MCVCERARQRSEGGPASERRNEWEIERTERERERESRVFGSRTTHVTRPAPLCVSHTVCHDRSYIHTITFTFCLQTSPYLWFIAQWRARCLLMVLPAAHGISRALFLQAGLSLLPRTDCADICYFLRMMETFHFSSYLLYFRVMNMLSIIFSMFLFIALNLCSICCLQPMDLYMRDCGNYQITWSHIL